MRRTILAVALVLELGCDFRCHTQHNRVTFTPRHQECDDVCVMHDKDGDCAVSMPSCTWIPDRCFVDTTCDLRCKTLDKGKTEAHTPHAALQTATENTAPDHCTDLGGVR